MLPNSNEPEVQSSAQGPGQGPAKQEQNVPEYVTKAILDERLSQIDESLKQFRNGLQEQLSKQYQGVQRQTDRYQNNVQSQISTFEQQLRDLQSKGIVKMSEEQIQQAVRDDKIDKLLQGQGQPQAQPGQPVGQPAPTGDDFTDRINAAASRIEQRHGVSLQEGDPEIAQFRLDELAQSPNYEDYLLGYEQASAAKAARVKQQGPARAPGLISHSPDVSNPLEGVKDLDAIWKQTSLGKIRG